MIELNYKNLLTHAQKEIEEFNQSYMEECKRGTIDVNSGLHTIFSLVFVPLLISALKSDLHLAKKMFDFIEKMETSEDVLVQEVSQFTVLEELADSFQDDELVSYLGKNTKLSMADVRQYIIH